MAANWEEVKRLAADFQRAQLSNSAQKLSERNCIEIVSKLIDEKLIEVYFTTDGKEYVTPQHLLQEIKDELFVQGGRIHLSELAQILSVDYSHVETRAAELAKNEKNIYFILGQLIDSYYLDRLFEEINEKLQQNGQTTIGELAKQYDLPPDFLLQMLRSRLGTIVGGQIDPSEPNTVFTQAFIARHKARIRGHLMAATKPIQVHSVIQRYDLQERLFFSVVSELLATGQLMGAISGGRNEKTAAYIPNVYAKAQNEWVDAFYKQNQYIEYDILTRLGIGDPRGFVRKRFKTEELTFLDSCAVGRTLLDQVEVAIEEALSSDLWADVALLCPSFFSEKDVQQVLQDLLRRSSKQYADTTVFCDTILTSNKFVQKLSQPFQQLMTAKAQQAFAKGITWNEAAMSGTKAKGHPDSKKERKDDRRKKATGGKSGGGTQGRETKTKSTKKKYGRGGGEGGSDDEAEGAYDVVQAPTSSADIPFLTSKEIRDVLKKQPDLQECSEQMIAEIAQFLTGPLTSKFQEVARTVFVATSTSPLRKTHAEVQEKVSGLVTNIHLFLKGIELFAAAEIKQQLEKHLLRTVCSDVINLLADYVAQESMVHTDQDLSTWTPEIRTKVITKLPDASREALGQLNTLVNGKAVDEFLQGLDSITGPATGDIVIKKMDKKKERQYCFSVRQTLLQQLSEAADPALVLHLTALILFHTYTGCLLHASGKFVPQILHFLAGHVTTETHQVLHAYQGLVIKHLTTTNDAEQQASIQSQLEEMTSAIKEIAVASKKGNPATPGGQDGS